jgi:hypothetical protein
MEPGEVDLLLAVSLVCLVVYVWFLLGFDDNGRKGKGNKRY